MKGIYIGLRNVAELILPGRAVGSARTEIPFYILGRSAVHRLVGFGVLEES
jgi:hypothetical protein